MAAQTSPRRSSGRRVRTNNQPMAVGEWYVPPMDGSAALAPRRVEDRIGEERIGEGRVIEEWIEPLFDESVLAHAAPADTASAPVAASPATSSRSSAWAGSDLDRLLGSPSSGRSIVLRVLVALTVVAVVLFTFFPAGVEADSAPLTTVPHVVQPGDTLWRLAEAHAPAGNDVRATIDQIKELNGLESSSLMVGDLLMLPAGG